MNVIDRYRESDSIELCEAKLLTSAGTVDLIERSVLVEHAMEVTVNTVPTLRIVCTPNHLIDLIVGRLYTEGIVEGIDDIEEICLCDQGTKASVLLSCRCANFSRQGIEIMPSCCTGYRTYSRYFTNDERPAKVVPIPWKAEWIFAASRAFAEDTPLHRTTTGTHSCYLIQGGTVVACCEDLGRHNAFDKVIGVALRKGINLCDALIFSSGRLPADMVMKAIHAGVPILATKAVPTDETIRLARDFDLTLVCQARPDSAVVYHAPGEMLLQYSIGADHDEQESA